MLAGASGVKGGGYAAGVGTRDTSGDRGGDGGSNGIRIGAGV